MKLALYLIAASLLDAQPRILHEVKGTDLVSMVGVTNSSEFTLRQAEHVAKAFHNEHGQNVVFARLALFSNEEEALAFDVGKGSFHSDPASWQKRQDGAKPCPALEVISVAGSLSARLCEANGAVTVLAFASADVFNWRAKRNEPTLAYVSVWPGKYAKAEGPAPDSVRLRLFFVCSQLPSLAVARSITERYGKLLKRPLRLEFQVSGTFVFDTYYPYRNPFLPSVRNGAAAAPPATEVSVGCDMTPQPVCRLR